MGFIKVPYKHHGIFLSPERVIHFTIPGSDQVYSVVCTSLDEFMQVRSSHSLHRRTHHHHLPLDTVVARAASCLGAGGYNLLSNNCETFCHWAYTGHKYSAQVGRGIGIWFKSAVGAALAVDSVGWGGLAVGGVHLGSIGLGALFGTAVSAVMILASMGAKWAVSHRRQEEGQPQAPPCTGGPSSHALPDPPTTTLRRSDSAQDLTTTTTTITTDSSPVAPGCAKNTWSSSPFGLARATSLVCLRTAPRRARRQRSASLAVERDIVRFLGVIRAQREAAAGGQ